MNQKPQPIQRTSEPVRQAWDRYFHEAELRSTALLEKQLRDKGSPWKRGLSRIGKN